jgi:predicted homoserine dehydrogenase-like protein
MKSLFKIMIKDEDGNVMEKDELVNERRSQNYANTVIIVKQTEKEKVYQESVTYA